MYTEKLLIWLLAAALLLSGCTSAVPAPAQTAAAPAAPEITGLTFESETPIDYAEGFRIYRYEGGYRLIDIPDGETFLVVPEGCDVPEVPSDIVPLRQPLNTIYLAATSAMSLFSALDAVDHIRLTGTQADGWFVEDAVRAMENGQMLFAGKYSEPDYELLIREDCCLAIESTMISHTPKVREMIEDLDIPVLVDRASYEPHPLGRTEWIKLYAALTGTEDAADRFFRQQAEMVETLAAGDRTGKTVVVFFVNTDGSVVIRAPQDYIPKMIDLAGGVYPFSDMTVSGDSASVSITMEEFYAVAAEADFLIYNASIDSSISSASDLIARDSLFADFKAVREGNLWSTGRGFYQATDTVSYLIRDIHNLLTGSSEPMTFLTKAA